MLLHYWPTSGRHTMDPTFELVASETSAATVAATRSKLFSSKISLELQI